MKPSTLANRAARVDAVLERLQLALSQGGALPGLDELSAVAHLSAFHFHRVWRALTGEPLGQTVMRLRLLRAALAGGWRQDGDRCRAGQRL